MPGLQPRQPVRALLALLAAVCAALTVGGAQAHPHVWVTMVTELVYGPDGTLTAVRHAWTFDDMFSAFATQGIEAKTKGVFTRAELAPLAQVNVDSLKEYNYFTRAKLDGKLHKGAFVDPVDYWLDYDPKATMLTLNFTLPVKTPLQAKRLTLEVYDPEFFVDFAFAEQAAVKLTGAPAGCTVATEKPNDGSFPSTLRLDKSFQTSEANAGMGMQFANRIFVTCP